MTKATYTVFTELKKGGFVVTVPYLNNFRIETGSKNFLQAIEAAEQAIHEYAKKNMSQGQPVPIEPHALNWFSVMAKIPSKRKNRR